MNTKRGTTDGERVLGLKYCPVCEIVKPLPDFPNHKNRKDGVACYCKLCSSKKSIASAKKNHVRYMAYRKKWLSENPKYHRKGVLKRLYGLTLEQYNLMLESQKFKCAICERDQVGEKLLHVDHCHTTGKIRGLLCQQCNHAIGLLQESASIIKRALHYIS